MYVSLALTPGFSQQGNKISCLGPQNALLVESAFIYNSPSCFPPVPDTVYCHTKFLCPSTIVGVLCMFNYINLKLPLQLQQTDSITLDEVVPFPSP